MLQDLRELADALAQLEVELAFRPLARVNAWHSSRTSQRALVQAVGRYRTILGFGGNRSGKTFIARCIVLALVLGSDHVDARSFWIRHGVDPDALPTGPGRGWIVALTSADSVEYHRKQFLSLIPQWGPPHPQSPTGKCWHVWGIDGMADARIEICVPGYDPALPENRATVVFKSDDPGPKKMQGSACRVILHDEESVRHQASTWDEADTRLWDQNGWHILTNTPIHGQTWVYHRWVRDGVTDPSREKVVYIYAEDNPYTDKSRLEAMKKRGGAKVEAKLYGRFVVLEGAIWGDAWDPAIHVLPTEPIDDSDGLHCITIDFGTRNPFAALRGVLTSKAMEIGGRRIPDGSIIVYAEYYHPGRTIRQHVKAIHAEMGTDVDLIYADPEDPQAILSLRRDHQWPVLKANNAVQVGLDAVEEWLLPDELAGVPRLYAMDCCVNLIREIPGYKWREPVGQEDPKAKPVKKDDHACDTLRYMVMGLKIHA